ncbi:MAG: hypothetical protein GXO75_16050 [Calditrichaeota bacterium]|nr:hypothetical protein [Calditrichota bacterium]
MTNTVCKSCELHIQGLWKHLPVDDKLRTPDEHKGVFFQIDDIDANSLRIQTEGGSTVLIQKTAFVAALHHLRLNRHDSGNKCEIRSSNNPADSGPLCAASREHNDGVRCINYILPILAFHGIVSIDGTRPNRTWIVC